MRPFTIDLVTGDVVDQSSSVEHESVFNLLDEHLRPLGVGLVSLNFIFGHGRSDFGFEIEVLSSPGTKRQVKGYLTKEAEAVGLNMWSEEVIEQLVFICTKPANVVWANRGAGGLELIITDLTEDHEMKPPPYFGQRPPRRGH